MQRWSNSPSPGRRPPAAPLPLAVLAALVGLLGAAAYAFLAGEARPPLVGLPPASSLAATETLTPAQTAAPATDTATPTDTAIPTLTALLPDTLTPAALPFQARYHPDGALYSGDQVSLEVIAPPGFDGEGKQLVVVFPGEVSAQTGMANFHPFGIDGRVQATFWWQWDTRGLPAGEYSLAFTLMPERLRWVERVQLHPAADLPASEQTARWQQAESECCLVYYVSGTEAERDLPWLLAMADAQAEDLAQKMGTGLDQAIPLVFLPRVLGHGGFAAEEIAVSYLDQNYAGGLAEIVVHHEMVHLLDARLGGKYRPSMLVEGLAVYLSGGHFKYEPLRPRAAALLPPEPGCQPLDLGRVAAPETVPQAETCGLDWFIPLETLAQDFYRAPHEIGYLQAGALVEYLVNTYGWTAYNAFYRDIEQPGGPEAGQPTPPPTTAAALEAALLEHFDLTLPRLESQFRRALQAERTNAYWTADLRLTVEFYDTVRRYQEKLDPSAYFAAAWLPDLKKLRERGITADVLRRPQAPLNLQIEAWLVQAAQALQAGEFEQVEALLQQVNAALGE